MGSLLTVFTFAIIKLIKLALKTSIGSSLLLLSLYSAFLLFLAFSYSRITNNFLINKLDAENYLPSLAKQVTKTFQMLVNYLLIDPQLLVSF